MRRTTGLVGLALALSWTVRAGGDEPPLPTLRLEREVRLEKLLGAGRWEASGVELVDGKLVVVLDDDPRLVRAEPDLSRAELVGERRGGSDFEGIAWDPQEQRLWVVVEETRREDGSIGPLLVEFDRELQRKGAPVALPLTTVGENKGIEGLAFLRRGGRECLLALYEGNHGEGGKRGKEKGHGKVAVLGRTDGGWEQIGTLELPPTAAFNDYAGIDLDGERLVVVSQASARVWVGRLAPDAWKVVDQGRVWALPPGYDRCEGVAWLDEHRLVLSSDAAKPDEDASHDQSLHVFTLPD